MALLTSAKGEEINISREEENKFLAEINKREDTEAARLKRYLGMADLSRTPGSPINEVVERIAEMEYFKGFDRINVPEIVSTEISFDLFNFAPDHVARKATDTYFVSDNYILRPHTTVMWYYYFGLSRIKELMKNGEGFGVLSHGKVYRKDEIDRNHMNIFHQIDGLYMMPRKKKEITRADLEEALIEVARSVFGKEVAYRFNEDTFPYTDPSLEMEVEVGGRWIEVLGGGIARGEVLAKLGVNPDEYTGWAFGFGLERLAIISMDLPDIRLLWSEDPRVKEQLHLGNIYQDVSKFPEITRDISFVVSTEFVPNNYFDLIRDIGGDLVEEVRLLDSYENAEKFGEGKKSYTYRIIYRSHERTLTNEEIDPLQKRIYDETAKTFNAELR